MRVFDPRDELREGRYHPSNQGIGQDWRRIRVRGNGHAQARFLGLTRNILTVFVHQAPLIACEALDYERRHLMSLRQGAVTIGGQLPCGEPYGVASTTR